LGKHRLIGEVSGRRFVVLGCEFSSSIYRSIAREVVVSQGKGLVRKGLREGEGADSSGDRARLPGLRGDQGMVQ